MTHRDTGNRAVPASLDLGMLWVAFLRALPIALVLGLLIGGATALVLDRRDSVYEVTATVSLGVLSDGDMPQWVIERAEPVYLSIAQDRETVNQVSTATGVEDPQISASASSVGGVIRITGEGSDVEQAGAVVDEVVSILVGRSARMHETAMFTSSRQAEELTAPLRRQIADRRAEEPAADVSDLEWQIEMISRDMTERVPEVIPPVEVSRTDNGGEPVQPRPLQTGLVVGMAAALLAAIPLTWRRFRHQKRVGRMWLRGLRHRYGVETESAPFNGGLSPLAEARAAETLAAGDAVLHLGRAGSLAHLESASSGRVHEVAWQDRWWREHPPTDIGLAVVAVTKRSKQLRDVEDAVAHLSATGIPTIVALNRSTGPDTTDSGTEGEES